MLRWLARLFGKKEPPPDPDSEPRELWSCGGGKGDWRWREEAEEAYSLRLTERGPRLILHRGHLFAWATNPLFRYRDFVLKASLSLQSEGYAAGGLVFRLMDEGDFYVFLVSNQARYRFDVVFNNKPLTLVPWTELPGPYTDPFEIEIAARGNSFVFAYNGRWAGEAADGTVEKGRFALAAQAYQAHPAQLQLLSITVESREVEIEHGLEDLERRSREEPRQRFHLASSLAAARLFREAAFQLTQLKREGTLDVDGRLLLSQCWLEEGLLQDALEEVEDILRKEVHPLATKQKASILYLQSRFLPLKEHVKEALKLYPEDPRLWMFLGHAEHHLGNAEAAAEAYEKWARLEEAVALAWMYAGKEKVQLGKTQEALPLLGRAAELFFRDEAFDDLQAVLRLLREVAPESAQLATLEGKAAFLEGQYDVALHCFERGRELGDEDPAADYLQAMILRDRGEREKAYELCRRAVEKEPGYDLFRFRLAELAYSLSRPEALQLARAACEVGPQNPWCWNVLGLCLRDPHQRLEAFEKAVQLGPGLEDPALNLAWERYRCGMIEQARELLLEIDSARSWNLLGIIFTDQHAWEEAERAYEKAIEKDPHFVDARVNLRGPLRKLGKMGKLDAVLAWLLERDPENPEYLLEIADTAFALGDWPRAEVSLRHLLEKDPGAEAAWRLLIEHYLATRRYQKAKTELDRAWDHLDPKIREAYRLQWLEATHEKIQCASCPRFWFLPRDYPDPGKLRLVGEPPPHIPAGRSPVTGLVYCVGCAQNHVKEGRFLCPDSGQPLVIDKGLVYLIKKELDAEEAQVSRVP